MKKYLSQRTRLVLSFACTVVLIFLLFSQAPVVIQAITPTPTAAYVCAKITVHVSPVTSPTSALTQVINASASGGGLYKFTVYVKDTAGNALGSYSSTPSGTSTAITINLTPGVTHVLSVGVSGEVACTSSSGQTAFIFTNGGTSVDTNGNPLVIVQSSATITPTATATNTPTPTVTPSLAPWNGNFHYYSLGTLVSYMGHIYKCIQAHTSQPNWNPVAVPALWQYVS